jgi:hypothetical protein
MLELAPGQRIDGLQLVIPRDGRLAIDSLDPVARQTADLAARSPEDQTFVSLDQVAVEGKVVDLADPRFGEVAGKLGFFDVFTSPEAGTGDLFSRALRFRQDPGPPCTALRISSSSRS